MTVLFDEKGNYIGPQDPNDPELNVTKAPPGRGAEVLAARNAAVRAMLPKTTAEEIEPSAVKRGLAAIGGRLQGPVIGLAEKAQLAFPGTKSEETVKRIGQERTERRNVQRQLEETPAGQFGGFVGQVAPFALAPQTVLAQGTLAGILSFLEGGPDIPEGLWNEIATSAKSGLSDAAVTALLAKIFINAGKGINAARGKYTPEGQKAMELDDAARRLGLPSPTIGQLDPFAPEVLRAHPERAMQQARALEQRIGAKRTVPSPAGGMEEQVVPGGMLKAGVEDAINARKQQADAMYSAVNDYVQANNLPNITPQETINVLQDIAYRYTRPGKSHDSNKIFSAFDAQNPHAFAWLKNAGSPKAARQAGMGFSDYQDARTLVNGLLTNYKATDAASRKTWQDKAILDLGRLLKALDADADRWTVTNATHKEAVALFQRARDFYRTVAAPSTKGSTLENMGLPIGHKGGYENIESFYNDIINPANRSLIDRLLPTASRETRDALNVLQNLPDVGPIVARSKIPTSAERSGLSSLVAGVTGHPGLALMEAAPGLRWLSSQRPIKSFYFGAPPTTRAMGPTIQYVADPISDKVQQLLGLPSPR